MKYLHDVVKVTDVESLQFDYPGGTLILPDNQAVIDLCIEKKQPVVAFEHDGVSMLKCDHILIDPDEVDDEEYEDIYRRCVGIPLFISETARTIIREFSMDDLDALFELYDNPGVVKYMEPLFEYEEERQYEENYIQYIYKLYGFGMWLIFDKTTGKLVGRAGIEVRESCDRENQAELGFCISPDRWKQGLAYEVCTEIIRLARDRFSLTSLVARCDPDNVASRGLMEKLGFSHIGFELDGDCRYFREIG